MRPQQGSKRPPRGSVSSNSCILKFINNILWRYHPHFGDINSVLKSSSGPKHIRKNTNSPYLIAKGESIPFRYSACTRICETDKSIMHKFILHVLTVFIFMIAACSSYPTVSEAHLLYFAGLIAPQGTNLTPCRTQ